MSMATDAGPIVFYREANADRQIEYLKEEFQRRGREIIEWNSAEMPSAFPPTAAAVIFAGAASAETVRQAEMARSPKIFWAIAWPTAITFSELIRLLNSVDVIVTSTSGERAMLEELTLTPLREIGVGVPLLPQKDDASPLHVSRDDLTSAAEALSAGTNVVFPAGHEFAPLILDGVNGFLAGFGGDRRAGVDAREDVAEGARRLWERHFQIAVVVDRIEGIIAEISRGDFRKRTPIKSYAAWIEAFDHVGEAERIALLRKLRALPRRPRISILMPVFNPDMQLLEAAIASVRSQLYQEWELCLADDASTDPAAAPYLQRLAADDSRIRLVLREQNGHIAACSNSALELATGEWIALLDQDDLLTEHALALVAEAISKNPEAGLIYSDEDKLDENGARREPYFKSDWNPQLFLVQNFISHLGVYRRSLLQQIGGFRDGFPGSQDYDLALRATEELQPEQIVHLPRVLYHWRKTPGSLAARSGAKTYAHDSARRALQEHFQRKKIQAQVIESPQNAAAHRIVYALPPDRPLVSLIIPTRDHPDLLRRCLDAVRERTNYQPYEIIVVDNNSVRAETKELLEELQSTPGTRLLRETSDFNFSSLVNAGARAADGELLLLLNDDVEPENSDWLEEMVATLSQPEVGVVGARLWYPDGKLQHGGVILGLGGVAGHAHYRWPRSSSGYFNRAILQQNFSAVTAACLLVRQKDFFAVGGFDQRNLAVSFNDVDFCLRLSQRGLRVAWAPAANLLHHESASRGRTFSEEKKEEFRREVEVMQERWDEKLSRDPYYNPNLSVGADDFELAWPPRVAPLDPETSRVERVFVRT